MGRPRSLLNNAIPVRFTAEQEEWLRDISAEEGRTVAQSVGLIVKIAMERGPYR